MGNVGDGNRAIWVSPWGRSVSCQSPSLCCLGLANQTSFSPLKVLLVSGGVRLYTPEANGCFAAFPDNVLSVVGNTACENSPARRPKAFIEQTHCEELRQAGFGLLHDSPSFTPRIWLSLSTRHISVVVAFLGILFNTTCEAASERNEQDIQKEEVTYRRKSLRLLCSWPMRMNNPERRPKFL